MDRKIISPYVREVRLPDLATSIAVADQALGYYQSVTRQFPNRSHPGACVALALYQKELDTEERIALIARMSGHTMNGFLKVLSETRHLLNVPVKISFDGLVQQAKLPVRLASTARKVFSDLQTELSGDGQLSRGAIYAAVMLVVAVKRGFKKTETLADLSRITSSDPEDVLSCERMIRDLLSRKYGFRSSEKPEVVRHGVSDEVRAASHEAMEQLKAEAGLKKKMTQKKLDFALIPRREPD
jgi:hypothetical protein